MIAKGSSGSYFVRARNEAGRIHTVAWVFRLSLILSSLIQGSVFKPKDEEPYGRLNPKVL